MLEILNSANIKKHLTAFSRSPKMEIHMQQATIQSRYIVVFNFEIPRTIFWLFKVFDGSAIFFRQNVACSDTTSLIISEKYTAQIWL